jgi:hypothetical protein
MMSERSAGDDVAGDSPWAERRVLIAVVAELSDRLTYRAFAGDHELFDVVSLITHLADDPDSYSARRFAIRALGNLQQLTDEVAEVIFTACQDIGDVYHETYVGVRKFKAFGPNSLEILTNAVRSTSVTIAYHAALLLGELGTSRSESLGPSGRQRVADILVKLLAEPLMDRTVFRFSKDDEIILVGPLYDVIYEALLRIVAGQDAPASRSGQEIQ